MHDDLSWKINEVLNYNQVTPEDELADALGDMARDIALIELNPQDWVWWGNYLLKSLQTEAHKNRISAAYEAILLDLREALETRIEGGKW